MAATFEWHVEFLRTDPNDDNFIKFITCGIYGTENGVTKKTLWRVPFNGKKSDIPVEDWKNYSDLMEGSGESTLISWCKNAIGSEQVAAIFYMIFLIFILHMCLFNSKRFNNKISIFICHI